MADETISSEEKPERRFRWCRLFVSLFILILIIVSACLAYGYFKLACDYHVLAKTTRSLQKEVTTNKNDMDDLHNTIVEMQKSLETSKTLAKQQAQLVSEWRAAQKGDMEKWYAAEAAYLVKLANDQVQFSHNIPLAIIFLQRGQEVLQNAQTTDLVEIRKTIEGDIANLQALPQVDITNLYLRLTSLDKQLDELVLPFNPLKAQEAPVTEKPLPKNLPWWKAGLERSWQSLQQIVIVRNLQSSQLPLVLPEEKRFLYQNLHAQMQNAIWGLLNRNLPVYQLSLAQATNWIKQYFDQDSKVTKDALENLQELIKIDIQPPTVNLNVLPMFNHYFAIPPAAQTASQ